MKKFLKFFYALFILIILLLGNSPILSAEKQKLFLVQFSNETQSCIDCHKSYTPGIVDDWLSSRHSKINPEIALTKNELEKRISSKNIPQNLKIYAVGCYECHSLNPSLHKDNFSHFGFKINVVVTPNDCKTCHTVEVDEYANSKKANALMNLQQNVVYNLLAETIIGVKEIKDHKINIYKPSETTKNDSCYGCHGTKVDVDGLKSVATEIGEIKIPNLTNWPNQGVGRINPDGSLGACTSCHPRHSFSIEIARKPYTCGQCHLEPDTPAWEVYKESKHGNIFFSVGNKWNWDNVPWKIGKDFLAPTCAVCHCSLIVNNDGAVIARRTHDFGSRLWVRLFGLIYSHPQPSSGKTYLIKNKDGLPLPTTFAGELASDYLINTVQQQNRKDAMKKICRGCHSTDWAEKFFVKLDSTIKETDIMTLSATQLMVETWDKNLADKTNPFDEVIEQKWVKQWLFYANSVRYASAMSGPDYAAFENGWWDLSNNLEEMKEWIEQLKIKN